MVRMPNAGDSVGMQEYIAATPMGRLGEADEVLSQCASFAFETNAYLDCGCDCLLVVYYEQVYDRDTSYG